jgi:ABC-2 type transport system permease protein
MSKFFILFVKEIKGLLTLRMVLPLVIMTVVFGFAGNLLGAETEKLSKPAQISIADRDSSPLTKELIASLEQSNFKVRSLDPSRSDTQLVEQAQQNGDLALLILPRNFAAKFFELEQPQVEIYNFINGFSLAATIDSSKVDNLKSFLNSELSTKIIAENTNNLSVNRLQNPIINSDHVVIKDRQASISFSSIIGFVQSQSTFVPIILFLVIIFASQMVATTIADEKENKTLEILLSSPVNRKTIILAKIVASGLVALLFTGFYLFGFASYASALTPGSGSAATNPELIAALKELGVVINPFGYLLLGLSLFASILCALAIAIILGILAEDIKSVQLVITPLMFLVMIPYFIVMFADLDSFNQIVRYLIYAIPFAHPFLAMQNILVQDYWQVFWGIIYQLLIFAIFVIIATRIFSTDRILTLRFKFLKKAS